MEVEEGRKGREREREGPRKKLTRDGKFPSREKEEEARREGERERGEEEMNRERAGERRKEEIEGEVPLSLARRREAT